jgi:hypothetical protein
MKKTLTVLIIFFGCMLITRAQVRTSGSISGTILDPSGAVVSGAQIRLKDTQTGAERETVSNDTGVFTFQNLQPGTYEVTVSLTGFQTALYSGVVVEAAKTTDINVQLQVGGVAESVQIQGATPILEVTSNTIANTVRNDSIRNLPLGGRNILNFALLVPGSQTAGGNGRNSTYNGMPGGTINITLDGINNNSQGFRSGGTSFFATVPPRLGAIEEVSIATAGLGADAGAEGAMQIRFVTKRGTNSFHGALFHQFRNDVLNANSTVSNARGLARPRLRFNEFGGNLGGPLWRNKLFFFVNYEQARIPQQNVVTNTVLTQEAQQGVFRYRGTDGTVRTANILEIARQNGFPGQINPIVADYFRRTNATWGNGSVTPSDLFRNNLTFLQRRSETQHYPTARLDYHITPNLIWTGSWNMFNREISPALLWPGSDFPEQDRFKNTWYIASTSLNWTISPRVLNEFRYGVQHNVDQFNVGENPEQFNVNGRLVRFVYPFVQPIVRNSLNISRANATHNLYDNVTLLYGGHTLTIGGALKYVGWYDADYQGNGAGIPTLTVGIAAGDPITSVLSSANLPAISGSDLGNAQSLYALLTGRVASINAVRALDVRTRQYQNTQLIRLDKQKVGGIYAQDSWRWRPDLTLNYGLRWEFTGAIYDSQGIYTSPTYEDLFGPSRSLFRPGVLDGVLDPRISLRPRAYRGDLVNPAPNFGFAWTPSFGKGLLGRLFGKDQATVIRAGYAMNYYDEGLLDFISYAGGNPGLTQSLFLNPGMAGFPLGQLSISDPVPPLATFPAAFSESLRQADYTFTNGFSTMKPKLRTPYVQTWNVGIQRELTKNTVIEVRYVGNHGTHLWHGYSINEVNIFENGFVQEFRNAQRNLALNRAAGVTSFANRGLAGQVPLPIFEAAFGPRGGQPALASGSGFANGTFITQLDQGQAGRLAATLAGNSLYLCRMVGSSLEPCARLGFNAAGPYPINFFQANPFAAGQRQRLMTDESYSSYHGLQIQFRRRLTSGLNLTANYTFSKTLTDLYADSATSELDYTTLRNRNLNKGPSPFDLRHVFQTYWSWDLPFGKGQRFAAGNAAIDRIIGGWTLSGILRWQSGRPFKLTSGRWTFNGADAGVVLNGITQKQLQEMVRVRPGPSGAVYYLDSELIGSDGRANPQFLTYPTTPGELGQFVYLYGPPAFILDLSLTKVIPITERVKLDFWATALNALNRQIFEVGGVAGTVSIDSTTFGQTTTLVGGGGPRNIQFRLGLTF